MDLKVELNLLPRRLVVSIWPGGVDYTQDQRGVYVRVVRHDGRCLARRAELQTGTSDLLVVIGLERGRWWTSPRGKGEKSPGNVGLARFVTVGGPSQVYRRPAHRRRAKGVSTDTTAEEGQKRGGRGECEWRQVSKPKSRLGGTARS